MYACMRVCVCVCVCVHVWGPGRLNREARYHKAMLERVEQQNHERLESRKRYSMLRHAERARYDSQHSEGTCSFSFEPFLLSLAPSLLSVAAALRVGT